MQKQFKHESTAQLIRATRERLNVTQKVFGEMLGGVPRYNIAKYESGATVPPGDIVLQVVQILQKKESQP